MVNVNNFGVGFMHELAITASKLGWESEDISFLSKNKECMKSLLGVVRGTHKIIMVPQVINTDKNPTVRNVGFTVKNHQKHGQIDFDVSMLGFFSNRELINTEWSTIDSLFEGLNKKEVSILNATVLDYLLNNQHLIPREWRENKGGGFRRILFLGTSFFNSLKDTVYYYSIHFNGDKWICDYYNHEEKIYEYTYVAYL